MKKNIFFYIRNVSLLVLLLSTALLTVIHAEWYLSIRTKPIFKTPFLFTIFLYLPWLASCFFLFFKSPPKPKKRVVLTFLAYITIAILSLYNGLMVLSDKNTEFFYSFLLLYTLALGSIAIWILQFCHKENYPREYTVAVTIVEKSRLFLPALFLSVALLYLSSISTFSVLFASVATLFFFATTYLSYFLKFTFRIIFQIVSIFITGIILFSYAISFYIQNTGFNDAFFFHLKPDMLFADPTLVGFVSLSILLLIGAFILTLIKHRNIVLSVKENHPLFFVALFFTLFSSYYMVSDIYEESATFNQEIIELPMEQIEALSNYALEGVKNVKMPSKPYNVIYIYLESVSRLHLEEQEFVAQTPNLQRLEKSSTVFTNIEETPYTGASIYGLFSTQSAFPLLPINGFTGNEFKGINKGTFMQDGYTLGDFFHELNYYQEYICGTNKGFSGTDKFLLSHHTDSILDESYFKEHYQKESFGSWGAEDGVVFETVFNRFEELSKKGEPFTITTKTLSTHGVYQDSFFPSDYEGEVKTPVSYLDFRTGELVDKIRNSPYSENTAIILSSDHLNFGKRRGSLLFMVNMPDGEAKRFDFYGTHMDIPDSSLSVIGFEYDGHFGIGGDVTKDNTFLLKTLYSVKKGEILPYEKEQTNTLLHSLYKSIFRNAYASYW